MDRPPPVALVIGWEADGHFLLRTISSLSVLLIARTGLPPREPGRIPAGTAGDLGRVSCESQRSTGTGGPCRAKAPRACASKDACGGVE